MIRILEGDCREVLRTLAPGTADAIITDPPYGLGFMGKEWDHGTPGTEVWEAALTVAKPGAHLLCFGGTRTHHRTMCAIEDAGWEIRDTLGWIYGSGFPKSKGCLKPSWEPIILARKPAPAPSLNIDACRVELEIAPRDCKESTGMFSGTTYNNGKPGGPSRAGYPIYSAKGRWPANLIHDGSDEVLDIFPVTTSGGGIKNRVNRTDANHGIYGIMTRTRTETGPQGPSPETGSAARFFYCAKASRTERGEDNPHPTVKPLALMRYLCRLVTPPGGTIIDPFCGSGSTLVAARLEGFSAIGIDRDPESIRITRSRLPPTLEPFTGGVA